MALSLDSDTEDSLAFPFPCVVSMLVENLLNSLKVGYLRNKRCLGFWLTHERAMEHPLQSLRTIPWVPGMEEVRGPLIQAHPFSPDLGINPTIQNGNTTSSTRQGSIWFALILPMDPFSGSSPPPILPPYTVFKMSKIPF